MISSSYYPPSNSSSNSTPQRTTDLKSELKDSGKASPRSPNFYEMPTTEILSSATTRSAFLQSLQRSREREERRERDMERELELEREREREKEKAYSLSTGHKYESLSTSDKYDPKGSNSKYESSLGISKYDSMTTTGYYNKYDDLSNSGSTNTKTADYQPQTNLSTPIMSRRRLSSSPASSKSSKSISATPIKPLNTATPVSQSKLASHAFTMSRSSDEGERMVNDSSVSEFAMGSMTAASVNDFKRKYEEEFNKRTAVSENTPSTPPIVNNHSHNSVYQSPKTAVNRNEDLKSLIDSVVETHTLSLKNDLQNLHIELIKQSVAQQSAFRSLLETYLPLTGKLMENLKEMREENEKLKMRIEELSRSSRY